MNLRAHETDAEQPNGDGTAMVVASHAERRFFFALSQQEATQISCCTPHSHGRAVNNHAKEQPCAVSPPFRRRIVTPVLLSHLQLLWFDCQRARMTRQSQAFDIENRAHRKFPQPSRYAYSFNKRTKKKQTHAESTVLEREPTTLRRCILRYTREHVQPPRLLSRQLCLLPAQAVSFALKGCRGE